MQLILEHITMNIFHRDAGGLFSVQSEVALKNCIPILGTRVFS